MRRVTVPGNLKLFGPKAQWSDAQIFEPAAAPAPAQEPSQEPDAEEVPVVVIREGPPAPDAPPSPLVAQAEDLVRQAIPPAVEFLVRYDGAVVGIYQAPRKIGGRTAYRNVAVLVGAERPDFDPRALQVLRLTPIPNPAAKDPAPPAPVGRFTRLESTPA